MNEHNSTTTPAQRAALRRHRTRARRAGLVRVEMMAGEDDATVLRELARRLRGREPPSTRLRRQLHRLLDSHPATLKGLLAGAPLAGVDLEREQDRGREFDPWTT